MTQAKTDFRVTEIVLLGPRWGTARRWIVEEGPPYYRRVGDPFTSRREALVALADVVNDAHSAASGKTP